MGVTPYITRSRPKDYCYESIITVPPPAHITHQIQLVSGHTSKFITKWSITPLASSEPRLAVWVVKGCDSCGPTVAVCSELVPTHPDGPGGLHPLVHDGDHARATAVAVFTGQVERILEHYAARAGLAAVHPVHRVCFA